jgi:hypothetical protein
MKNIEKILNFNGKEISLVLADGQWWIALRPVLDALNVDADWHLRAVKNDEILVQHLCEHTGVAADGKDRKMLCLPEKFIYGWLFTINADSPQLKEYKEKCYDILFAHFHGRFSALVERVEIDERLAELEAELATNEKFAEIKALEERRKKIAPALRKMDNDLMKGQTRLSL